MWAWTNEVGVLRLENVEKISEKKCFLIKLKDCA